MEITGWAGPWPVWSRWWTPGAPVAARMQVACVDGSAFLLLAREGFQTHSAWVVVPAGGNVRLTDITLTVVTR